MRNKKKMQLNQLKRELEIANSKAEMYEELYLYMRDLYFKACEEYTKLKYEF